MKTHCLPSVVIGLVATLFVGSVFQMECEAQQAAPQKIAWGQVKCPVMTSRTVDPEFSTEFDGAQVYFCCPNCLAKFKSDPQAYQEAAVRQIQQVRSLKGKSAEKPLNKNRRVDAKPKIDPDELREQLAAAVKEGRLTETQAKEKYLALVSGKMKKGQPKGQPQGKLAGGKSKLKSKGGAASGFLAKLGEFVDQGKLTKEEATQLYNLSRGQKERVGKMPTGKKKQPKAGPRGADYKIGSLAAQKELSKHLPTTSTGDDREGPVACGFFGWAADATHRFMDNSHQGKPRLIEGLSFRLDHRDHDTIGRTWEKITLRIAHGDWSTIEYNASKDYELVDQARVVFDKEWSFPTLKGYPSLEPAEWGGPQNCLHFRFDQPFEYNGKDAIFVEFVFQGGKTEDGRKWEGDLPYGFEYYLDSMPEAGGWRVAEKARGIYRGPRVEAVVSYTADGQSVWTSSPKGMPYLKWDFRDRQE